MEGRNGSHDYFPTINDAIESFRTLLEPLNKYIHDNPELAFEEYKAHDALTSFMRSQKDWRVTSSAYGIATAWIAVYDSGKAGPVVSFNAEMGTVIPHVDERIQFIDIDQMHSPNWATRVATTSLQPLHWPPRSRQPVLSQSTIYPARSSSSERQGRKVGAAVRSVCSKRAHIRTSTYPSYHTPASSTTALACGQPPLSVYRSNTLAAQRTQRIVPGSVSMLSMPSSSLTMQYPSCANRLSPAT